MAVSDMDYAHFQSFHSSLSSDSIKVDITHSNLQLRIPEYRIPLQDTTSQIKQSLTFKLGTNPEDMSLILKDLNGTEIHELDELDTPFSSYNPVDGYTLHVVDNNPLSITKELNDVTQVPKYVMSKAEYRKRPVTVKKYFKQLKVDHPDLFGGSGMEFTTNFEYMKIEAENIEIGARCEVKDGSGSRGEVMYVGQVPEIKWGWFVGVKLDLARGKNDGSCQGVSYFNCEVGYGLFLRPDMIRVGDFEPLGSEEEDIDEI
jgi:tubulin-folding cofactor B